MTQKICSTKLIVKGIVQGVGYRYFVQKVALEENVCGYVKNNPDGNVEILAICDKNKLEKFLSRIKTQHPYAVVKEIEIIPENIYNYSTFVIKY